MLPFTAEVFFSVFEQYNRAIWPTQIVAYGLGLVVVLLTLRPVPGGNKVIGALLAAAPAFGAVFIVQALLFGWTVAIGGKIVFRFRADVFGWTGLGFVLFAMAVYPLVGWLAGHGWPRAPLFGVAPCPTTIFTLGVLLLTEGRTPLRLVLIPVLWSLVGGTAAWLLSVPEDLALPLAGLGGLGLILWK